jgi:hypothetical protein
VFNYSGTELAAIDQLLEPKLGWATTRYAEAHQLALDATRLLSCTNDRLEEYKSKGFFKRAWYRLSGKTGDIQRANQSDLMEAQKIGWRYLEVLNERDLLQAQSIISIRNNLLTLATKEEETRRQVTRLAEKVYERFVRLEDRVDKLEAAQQIHAWLLTIRTNDYDEKFPPHLRMLRVVNDFIALKPGAWNMMELKYLQTALREADVEWKRELSLEDFVDEVVNEIGGASFSTFEHLLLGTDKARILPSFVQENVAVPSYLALFEIASTYSTSSATIDVLREELKIERSEAIKRVLRAFMLKQGIDLRVRMQLRWLAIELLDCMQLARALAHGSEPESVVQEKSVVRDGIAALVEKLDLEARPAAFVLLAAREVTIEWNDPRPTVLVITHKDECWSATIRDSLTDSAVLAVRPAVKSRVIFALNEATECKIAPAEFGTELRLSYLKEIVITDVPGHKLLPPGIVNVRLDYATSAFFKNVTGKVTWR